MAGEVVNTPPQNFDASLRARKVITFGPTTTSGTSSATSATTLTDGGAAWVVNAYAGLTVYSNGSSGVISSNTSTVLTVASWTGGTPTDTKPYMIAAAGVNGPIGSTTIFTASGVLIVRVLLLVCNTTLTGPSSTISVGNSGGATPNQCYLGTIDATTWTSTNCFWTPAVGVIAKTAQLTNAQLQNQITNSNIIFTIAAGNITAGVITADVLYDPVTDGATLT